TVPDLWPAETFDLLVISELGYYLDAEALDAMAVKARASLSAGGTVLACHWRWPIAGCPFDGDEVHRRLDERLGLRRLTRLSEPDLLLDVWSDDGRSVGEHEGLTP
ncbi:MAG: SAM-dependent methyltransferase, partial [Lautropia sp.]